MDKKALILGVTDQDSAYQGKYLLGGAYNVNGTSRDVQIAGLSRLSCLGVREDVEIKSLATNDFRSVLKVVSIVEPDEIYKLAGQTSVGLSLE